MCTSSIQVCLSLLLAGCLGRHLWCRDLERVCSDLHTVVRKLSSYLQLLKKVGGQHDAHLSRQAGSCKEQWRTSSFRAAVPVVFAAYWTAGRPVQLLCVICRPVLVALA